jgi:hypothetical protein
MNWLFYINDVAIEEPIGFDEIVFNILRDENWRGVFFEASTSALQFYGEAFDILQGLKISYGVDALAIFRADVRCEGEAEYSEAIRGKLNFAQYKERCGNECLISLPVEQDGCIMTLRNRYDQKVNIDSNIAFNKSTVLQDYTGLGFNMELSGQNIPVSSDASVENDEPFEVEITVTPSVVQVLTRPIYDNEIDASLQDSQLSNPAFFFEFVPGDMRMSPQLLLDFANAGRCYNYNYNADIRLKGRIRYDPIDGDDIRARAWANIGFWNALNGTITGNIEILNRQIINDDDMNEGQWYEFDVSYVNPDLSLPFDVGIYAYVDFWANDSGSDNPRKRMTIEFDDETHFTISTIRSCPPTEAEVYMVNETLSRVTEAITDVCLRVKSDYYGRTDSQPFTSAQDGCGSLRVLTNGLKIRQAENDNFAVSLKDLFEGLNAIDNIGMGVEGSLLRIEPAEYFYNDTKIMDIALIPQAVREVVESRIFSLIKVGYKKWETESVKGLDEFNSNKQFRTGIKSVNNPLDITSAFIAAGYVIENIRTQLFSTTGRADNRYDNDTFIICVERAYAAYIVEQGNAENPANIFSPETAYNWRIRPMYNLMRWAKTILSAYPNPLESASKLFFTDGTGNYVATGQMSADPCKLESGPIAENADLHSTNFAQDVPIIIRPEDETFEYPLSVAEYKLIKANPYGFINLQCGHGEFIKAYINNIEYNVAQGRATFNLSIKWV